MSYEIVNTLFGDQQVIRVTFTVIQYIMSMADQST